MKYEILEQKQKDGSILFYIPTSFGFICSWDRTFPHTWSVENLEDDVILDPLMQEGSAMDREYETAIAEATGKLQEDAQ